MHFSVRLRSVHNATDKTIRHDHARTWRSQGTGSYRTGVHGALNHSDSARTWWERTVYSVQSHSCAAQNSNNAASQTCSSATWTTANRLWYNTSSHRYRVGASGDWTREHWIQNQYYDCREYVGTTCKSISRPF
jgi:hypothetical protein